MSGKTALEYMLQMSLGGLFSSKRVPWNNIPSAGLFTTRAVLPASVEKSSTPQLIRICQALTWLTNIAGSQQLQLYHFPLAIHPPHVPPSPQAAPVNQLVSNLAFQNEGE
jgi:hypothetical protein